MNGLSVAVVMPWRDMGDKDRQDSFAWVKGWYKHYHAKWDIVEADSPADEPWNKPTAINNAITATTADVVVVTDTDVVPMDTVLSTAVGHAATASWVVPHGQVLRLRAEPTRTLLAAPYGSRIPVYPLVRNSYSGVAGGGLFVIRRERFLACGGFDAEFRGWGAEDTAFGYAADTLLGPHLRYHHVPLVHLYHDPGPRETNPHFGSNSSRLRMYQNYNSAPKAMAAFRNVPVPHKTKLTMEMPRRTASIEEWLNYLNYKNIKVDRRTASQKSALMKIAVHNYNMTPRHKR